LRPYEQNLRIHNVLLGRHNNSAGKHSVLLQLFHDVHDLGQRRYDYGRKYHYIVPTGNHLFRDVHDLIYNDEWSDHEQHRDHNRTAEHHHHRGSFKYHLGWDHNFHKWEHDDLKFGFFHDFRDHNTDHNRTDDHL
ncbi:hypothetical protein AAVH_30477, partial [Aphelenchoides avenae]